MYNLLKSLVSLALAGLLTLPGVAPAGSAERSGQEEFRAVWVATVYNLDYPSKGTANAAALRREADEILQTCAQWGMNAVILQVRPTCDAFYPSQLFPWSRYLTGTPGTAPTGGFDPLAYWVEQAHALGLELHAWVNPYRVTRGGEAETSTLSPDNPAVLHPDWVVEYEDNYYLNPGLPQVRELVIQGAEELARNYDIDGIHLDDYFYPGSDFDDAAAFAQYGGRFGDIGDWRRENVNLLVKTLGERLHAIDPDLSYGISPSGVWGDSRNLPGGSATTGGYESYHASYADSRKWVQEGWIDYICPQIYWYIGHKSMDYSAIARWWAATTAGTDVKLYVGMADYQAGSSDPESPWYGTQAIQDQLALNDTLPQVTGEVHFRYKLIAANAGLTNLYQQVYGKGIPPSTLSQRGTAYATSYSILVDGKPVSFDAYALKDASGNDTNYLKLRDVAHVLNGTAAQFDVTWDERRSTIMLNPGAPYRSPNGSEMSTPFSGDQSYTRSNSAVLVGTDTVHLSAITLTDANGGGYTYFQLRELGEALGFGVEWDAQAGAILIQTDG